MDNIMTQKTSHTNSASVAILHGNTWFEPAEGLEKLKLMCRQATWNEMGNSEELEASLWRRWIELPGTGHHQNHKF